MENVQYFLKRGILFIVTIGVLSVLFSFNANIRKPYKVRTVVIDAGHGGKDSGCRGSIVNEKYVALAIAKKLGNYIQANYSGVKVVYTRDSDKFVELYERARIANREKADLFVSIHCNSSTPSAYGTETYSMGLHRSEANLNVAKFENNSIPIFSSCSFS